MEHGGCLCSINGGTDAPIHVAPVAGAYDSFVQRYRRVHVAILGGHASDADQAGDGGT